MQTRTLKHSTTTIDEQVELHLNKQIQEAIDRHVIYTTTDLNGYIQQVSPVFCTQSGYTREELIGRTHALLRSPDTTDDLYSELWETIEHDEIWHGEIKNVAKNGEPYWFKCVITPLFTPQGDKIGYIAMRDNITREKEIQADALIDELTKVYNRKKINQDIADALERFERYDSPCTLVLLDIDSFKTFNDRYGHLIGDEILKQISSLINTNTRSSDIFARWGGDEFALLIPGVSTLKASQLCNILRESILKNASSSLHSCFDISEHISCSFGLTAIQKGDTMDSLLGRTDRALYLAKEKGRNRVEIL